MVVLLTDEDVKKLFTIKDAMEVCEDVLRERALGGTAEIPRSRLYALTPENKADFWMNAMAAGVPKLGVAVMRLATAMNESLRTGVEKITLARKTDVLFLYSTDSAEMLAIIHADYISKLRVGALTGICTQHMARADAGIVGVFGSGRQARANLMGIALARKIRKVKVYSPNTQHCDAYCREMSAILDIDVLPATPQAVVEGSDVVLAASNSKQPVFRGEWLKKGAHVIGVRSGDFRTGFSHELDSTTLVRADVIAVNSKNQIYLDNQRWFLDLIEQRRITPDKICELGDIVAGKHGGRLADDQITLYDNNVGMGIQFAACGAFVMKKAKELGLGQELPDVYNAYRGGLADTGLSHGLISPGTYSRPGMRE